MHQLPDCDTTRSPGAYTAHGAQKALKTFNVSLPVEFRLGRSIPVSLNALQSGARGSGGLYAMESIPRRGTLS